MTTSTPSLDQIRRQSNKYSLSRLIKSKFTNNDVGCLEREISQDLEAKFGRKEFDFLIPPETLGLRAISTDNSGGNLIAIEKSDYRFFAPEPDSKLALLGAKILTNLKDQYEINGSAQPFQAHWVGERGQIADSQPPIDRVILKPKKLVASCTMTMEMWHCANEFSSDFLAAGMGRALWTQIDRALLVGSGVNQPLGLASQVGINSIVLGSDGGELDWAGLVQMESLVTRNNPSEKNLSYLINSDCASYLKRTERIAGSREFILSDQPLRPTDQLKILNSRLCGVSNNLPNNLVKGSSSDLSMALFGNWSSVVIGIFGAIDVQVDEFSNNNFANGLVTLRMAVKVDTGVLNPSLFSIATDIRAI
ncbi:MAG TPA: phage major capsid protein [Coleofasciculaceae cyanobacterium]|jgi:HK97 family phage major capsid protein